MRVSIDNSGSTSKPSSLVDDSFKGQKSKRKGKGSELDQAQKIKAGVAIGVIVLAACFIAWNLGLFQGRGNTAAPAEMTQADKDAIEELEQQQRSTGGSRLPPMPLGAN